MDQSKLNLKLEVAWYEFINLHENQIFIFISLIIMRLYFKYRLIIRIKKLSTVKPRSDSAGSLAFYIGLRKCRIIEKKIKKE